MQTVSSQAVVVVIFFSFPILWDFLFYLIDILKTHIQFQFKSIHFSIAHDAKSSTRQLFKKKKELEKSMVNFYLTEKKSLKKNDARAERS